MFKKSFFLISIFFLLISSFAQELEVNGGFERVAASRTGEVLPEGWLINKSGTENSIVLITKNPAEVRNGNFALWLEGEEETNRAYLLRYASTFSVKTGDVVSMSIWAQGKGEVSLGVIANGTLPETGQKHGAKTVTGGRIKVDSPNEWQLCEFKINVKAMRKNDLTFNELSFVPIIYCFNMDILLLDDCSFQLKKIE